MKKRWIGYAVWLLLAACLYFFENNTGTRVILLCSLLFPLIPVLRSAFFSGDGSPLSEALKPQTVKAFVRQEAEEPGDVRLYQPGDPVRRIHWKLSARRDELLVREMSESREILETEQTASSAAFSREKTPRTKLICLSVLFIVLCVIMLLLIPDATRGAQALCNRVFAASEAVNAYVYEYFPVKEGQSVVFAAILLVSALLALVFLTLLLRSRWMALSLMGALTLFQVYFGLPFPDWANILIDGSLSLWMIRKPADRKTMLICLAAVMLISLFVMLLFPGVDAATEEASERVRDHLNRMARQMTGTVSELPEGETETRHVHSLSLQNGDNEAQADREYRLVTVEEEQISLPRFISWIRIILLLLLLVAVIVLPFAPFLLLNMRKKRAEEARKAFASENVSVAVCAIFSQVITWLKETGHDMGNLLYIEWTDHLPSGMPDGYALRFSACAKDYEEAAYSSHSLPEEKRQLALALLKETETALFRAADWKQRLRIRYWVCLCE